jgi:hypothetical protein
MRYIPSHRPTAFAATTTIIALLMPNLLAHAQTEPSAASRSQLKVEANFPNGSGRVIEIDHTSRYIRIEPTTHELRGWACWWYIRVSGIVPGEMITIEVGPEPWATPSQAMFSTDDRSWQQTAPGESVGRSIKYQQTVDAPIAWFAWGPPFTVADASHLVDQAKQACDDVQEFTLCETRGGREVPGLRFQPRETTPTSAIWVQARQHAWEAGSSWVCKGFVEWLVSDDPRAARLRSSTIVTVVPIMDIDNVAIGAGGKNQVPHDHNRDWSEQPHWRSVAEAMRELRRLDEAAQLDLFVDLHNPGANTTRPFYYVPPRELMTTLRQRNLDRFLAASRIEMTGPLQFTGEIRESGPEYDEGWKQISKNWVTLNSRDHVVATTLETSWNTPDSTIDGYQTVGRQLGLAIERYLQLDPHKATSQETKPGQQIR